MRWTRFSDSLSLLSFILSLVVYVLYCRPTVWTDTTTLDLGSIGKPPRKLPHGKLVVLRNALTAPTPALRAAVARCVSPDPAERFDCGATLLDEALAARIRTVIRDNATPRHVPAKILAVPDIPRTISGKLAELAVRSAVHGEPVKNTDALANPGSLAAFRDRPELAD